MVAYDGVIELVDDVHGEGIEAPSRKLYSRPKQYKDRKAIEQKSTRAGNGL